ncbi:MAG: hypothetical protein QXI89_00300 [Candidatus Anstonellales archaeon]
MACSNVCESKNAKIEKRRKSLNYLIIIYYFMAEEVFFIPSSKYAKAKALLEQNPYEEQSFSRVGYKIREAKSIGLNADGYFLYIKASDDFIKFARDKLKEVLGSIDKDMLEKAKQEIEKEEQDAISGFGSLFG